MVKHMDVLYRSKYLCKKKLEYFTSGGFAIMVEGEYFTFDFVSYEASEEIREDGHTYMSASHSCLL